MIFEDRSRRRGKLLLGLCAVVLVTAAAALADFAYSLWVAPALPDWPAVALSRGRAPEIVDSDSTEVSASQVEQSSAAQKTKEPGWPAKAKPFVTTAFLVHEDPGSVASMKRNIERLDAVIPDWYTFGAAPGQIVDSVDASVTSYCRSHGVAVLARISNTDPKGIWNSELFTALAEDKAQTERFAAELAGKLVRDRAQGVNLDIENVDPGERDAYLDWLRAVCDEVHGKGLYVTVDVPMNDEAFDYEAIAGLADSVIVMAYDQSYAGGSPGPIAGFDWFNDGIDEMSARIPPAKLLVALGAYGYDWDVTAKSPARSLGFVDAMVLARGRKAEVEMDLVARNSTFAYDDEKGHHHAVWLLDAASAWNQNVKAKQHHIGGVSLWRLGYEEPGVWDFLPSATSLSADAAGLTTVHSQASVCLNGNGEILAVPQIPVDGARDFTFDEAFIDSASYRTLPRYFEVEKYGHVQYAVALTFDDGPDPKWTPRILDALKRNGVRATFFVVGDQAQQYPELVERIYKEGHILGNHTWLHPNLQVLSQTRLRLELNATQRLIENITGHQTLLFRAPYDTDTTPVQPQQLLPAYRVGQFGYIVVGADIDSVDYLQPGASQIVANVTNGLNASHSNIVVLHDAGGDRSQTVEALDRMIPAIRNQGYSFVTVDALLNSTPARIMPAITTQESWIVSGSSLVLWLRTWGWQAIVVLFFLSTLISLGRIVFLGALVVRGRRGRSVTGGLFEPPVVLLIPAYNESKVIARTLEAAVRSDYPNLRIVVVDDGSTDSTTDVVEAFARSHPQVTLLEKANGGKFSALNLGFAECPEEFIVTIDADTLIMPNTVRDLIQPFAKRPDIDAVCGNVQVGNVNSILTAFQEVEYVTSQNYDRRAFEALNAISVVPGATGAWRRSTVQRAGGYSQETLTEDADLTLTILERGGRIVYAPTAKSITEAPECAGSLFKQRFRWSYGTLQCLWKHRASFFRGSLGWAALPNMLIFQLLFPLLSPIGDLVLLGALFRRDFGVVALGYVLFLVLDLIGSTVAFKLDGKPLRDLWVVLIQRFYYRQFMYVVTFRSLLAAVLGRRHGWNKLERKGTVQGAVPVPRALAISVE